MLLHLGDSNLMLKNAALCVLQVRTLTIERLDITQFGGGGTFRHRRFGAVVSAAPTRRRRFGAGQLCAVLFRRRFIIFFFSNYEEKP